MTFLAIYFSCMFLYGWSLWSSGLFGDVFSWKLVNNDWDLFLEIIFWPIQVLYATYNRLSNKDNRLSFVKAVYFYFLDLFNL